jgi:hypothetical protein
MKYRLKKGANLCLRSQGPVDYSRSILMLQFEGMNLKGSSGG